MRLGIPERIAFTAFIGATAVAVGVVALPLAYHDLSESTWRWIFWPSLGIAVLALIFLISDGILYLVRRQKKPTIICSFDMKDIGGCVCPNVIRAAFGTMLSTSAPTDSITVIGNATWPLHTISPAGAGYVAKPALPENVMTYYRIKVSAENGTIIGAKGRLISLKRNSTKLVPEAVDLPFAPAEAKNKDRLNKTIYVGSPEHLDFLLISNTNHVELALPDFHGPSSVDWQKLFQIPGDYSFDIKILSPAAEASITLFFHWTGKRETSQIIWMH